MDPDGGCPLRLGQTTTVGGSPDLRSSRTTERQLDRRPSAYWWPPVPPAIPVILPTSLNQRRQQRRKLTSYLACQYCVHGDTGRPDSRRWGAALPHLHAMFRDMTTVAVPQSRTKVGFVVRLRESGCGCGSFSALSGEATIVIQRCVALSCGWSVLAVPGLEAFSDRERGDDQCGGRVGPPPAERGVQADAGQGGGGGVGAEGGLGGFGDQGAVARARPVRCSAIARSGMTMRAAAVMARPGMDSPGRARVTRSWMLSAVR